MQRLVAARAIRDVLQDHRGGGAARAQGRVADLRGSRAESVEREAACDAHRGELESDEAGDSVTGRAGVAFRLAYRDERLCLDLVDGGCVGVE